ncbi:threonine ammonia-lyase [Meiothermus ruber]|jgi:threonine dehydratase|uniref:threonine ammonia-lyase n=1 Tax=Meiothermus ruber (strain ATCC 35948 / DSM 1279 / VKM B-1258 / 21) TaxID=504728 RepID=D3PNR6_MEIRD|nr:threonine ammonia-lyase [Meiothermus ruber]GIW32299.1 MAG: threonine ammonia-lyase [Meiothermus sp.]ADD29461.1 threonine dehydratase [Meiothermus ruber DSM 1279]AGK05090.1 threonine dehydratase [Meiothermus ruber DSM 1279]MCL6529330.1 threonine ammonia-lyase [Meiothermus ruber]GAO76382.1 threonine dehydratase [Meiothermus ruber H328]
MAVRFEDIQAARAVIRKVIASTPTLPDPLTSDELGARVFVKAECLQRGGSFKIRGAYHKIAALTPEEKARGVIAPSAGNHAQGVALAASLQGIRSTIVMPQHAPLTKVVATRRLGAEVVLHGASFDDAVAHAHELQEQHGYTYVHAFNDEKIIAGQGTIGLELLEALPDLDVLVVPIGGGGLIGGIALAVKHLRPQVQIVGVQAAGCAPVNPSLRAGHPVSVPVAQTIADGIAVKRPGELTLPLIQQYVDQVLEVTDDEIARGIVHCAQHLKLVVEGAGAAGMGAILAGKVPVRPGQTVATVLCGGNIDGNLLSRVIEQVMVRQGRYLLLKLAVVDRPGALARVVDHVAAAGANIIDIFHRRALWLAPLGKVGVELVLEVRDAEHGKEVMARLEQAGYHPERERVGEWPD